MITCLQRRWEGEQHYGGRPSPFPQPTWDDQRRCRRDQEEDSPGHPLQPPLPGADGTGQEWVRGLQQDHSTLVSHHLICICLFWKWVFLLMWCLAFLHNLCLIIMHLVILPFCFVFKMLLIEFPFIAQVFLRRVVSKSSLRSTFSSPLYSYLKERVLSFDSGHTFKQHECLGVAV